MLNYIKTALGIVGNLSAEKIDQTRYIIYEDDEYLGIYDAGRKTFVD